MTIYFQDTKNLSSILLTIIEAPSLSVLRLKIRELNDAGIAQLANVLKEESCNITRLEISKLSFPLSSSSVLHS